MTGIPADLVAQASAAYDAAQVIGDAVYWIEGRTDGSDVLVRWTAETGARDVTPAGMSVASHVHEYGGGAHLVSGDTVWFCNADDQRVYRQDLHGPKAPLPVTPEPQPAGSHRYADLSLCPGGTTLICVRERHEAGGVANELVALPADGHGPPRTVASGWDFYSFPRPSPDGRWLAWTCWNAPYMPWDATWLFVAPLRDDGRIGEPVLIAGGPDESVFQPQWSPEGVLHFVSDRTGWWNLYAWRDGRTRPVLIRDAELGVAQWEFGYSTYAFLSGDRIVVLAQRGGRQSLLLLHDDEVHDIELRYCSIKPYLSGHGSTVALIAAGPTATPGVVRVDVDTGGVRRLTGTPVGVHPGQIARPEHFTFPTRDGAQAHGLYYRPAGHGARQLIVKAHPGPTANFPERLDWHTQFLVSRGYGVAEVDYRGSTGYGRSYRQALQGHWGRIDAYDCADAAEHLVTTGHVPPGRNVIWGASAGGYTALRALSLTDTFTAAIIRSPVVDPATWRRAAPKFQAHHADNLTGTSSTAPADDKVTRPVLILHGEMDPVTPIQESRELANQFGSRARLIEIPGEGHTFRTQAAIRKVLEEEQAFLESIG